jgi:hypothetical protein
VAADQGDVYRRGDFAAGEGGVWADFVSAARGRVSKSAKNRLAESRFATFGQAVDAGICNK